MGKGKKKQKKLINMSPRELVDLLVDSVRKGEDELRINEISTYIIMGMIPKEPESKTGWVTGPLHDPFRGFSTEKLFEKAKELLESDDAQENIEIITKLAAELMVRDYANSISDKKFIELSDDDKMKYMKSRHGEFISKYPIVAQYLVLDKKFHHTAFHKFLRKTRDFYNDEEMRKIEKKKAWCLLQAYYVKYLVTEYNDKVSAKEAGKIYEEAAEKMIKDYEEFEEEYERSKKEIDELERANKKDMLNHIVNHIDFLSDEQVDHLESELETRVNKQNFSTQVLHFLISPSRKNENAIEGMGSNVFAIEHQLRKQRGGGVPA